ncbi:TVP38/TMEM64 family protein [Kiritimatiellota bacterium B12222]|nr:TVP38/TMEM64 family protein [Kiritimatiellota bacterium B12222]
MPNSKFPLSIKRFSIVLLVIALVLALRFLPISEILTTFNEQVSGWGIWGIFAFIVVYIVATVFMIPASILTLGAGFAFGLATGMVTVSIASTLGATASFLVSRYLARDRVKAKFGHHEKFAAVDQAVSQEGWKIVALLRLSPIFPFNALNYILGLTGIRFPHYVLASWAGMLPGTLLYVYLGYLGQQGLETATEATPAQPLRWVYLALGLLATLGVSFYITRLASKAMKKQTLPDLDS